jgi:retinol dehydrogenase 12
MSLSVSDFFYTQLFLKIPKPTASFASKTVIVTGANSGLGKEAVKHIVSLGASKVILGCRDTSKGNAAKLDIESSLKCSPNILDVWQLDLESYASIKEFATRSSELPRLDVLINNAGLMSLKFQVVYGTEKTIAVNVIGTFLLSFMLLPKLKETAKMYGATPHLTFVTSALYSTAK